MNEEAIKHLAIYNQLWMELDDLYANYAKYCGMSNCVFWIFYTLYESGETYTQKNLSEILSLSRQTVNSALKGLESEGLITLVPLPGQRKNKEVALTDAGKSLVQKRIVPLLKAEQNTFKKLSPKERETFLQLTKKYIGLLKTEIQKAGGCEDTKQLSATKIESWSSED